MLSCGWEWVAFRSPLFDQGAEIDRETTLEYLFSLEEAWDEEGGHAYILILDRAAIVGILNRTTFLFSLTASGLVWTSRIVLTAAVRIQQVF